MLPTITYRPRTIRRRELPELNSFFDELLGRPLDTWSTWMPSADFYETEDGFVLEIELPGYAREELEVTVEKGVLTVSGEHDAQAETEGRAYYCRERSTERFSRSFSLPQSVNPEGVEAEMESGVLFVTLSKVEEAKPRKVEVRVR
jgi:HSP20 family molecular chaperone IbpA